MTGLTVTRVTQAVKLPPPTLRLPPLERSSQTESDDLSDCALGFIGR